MIEEKILKIVGKYDYKKGINYSQSITERKKIEQKNFTVYEYFVPSESNLRKMYLVNVIIKDGNFYEASCSCPQYSVTGSCKHVAATLIRYGEQMLKSKEEVIIDNSKMVLDMFYKAPKKNGLKKQLKIGVKIIRHDSSYYENYVEVKFKIGENKMYALNPKLYRFLSVVEEEEGEVFFGKEFTYNYDNYYFNEEDSELIKFLIMLKNRSYYNFSNFYVNGNTLDRFMKTLQNKEYEVENFGTFRGYIEDNPYNVKLVKKDNYELKISATNLIKLADNSNFIIKDNMMYKVPNDISLMLSAMKEHNLDKLEFREDDLDKFTKSVLPIVKNNIKIDKKLEDKIIIGTKPDVKLYIDYYYNAIVCNVKLFYNEKEINYFDEVTGLIRDNDYEEEIVKDLLEYNFKIDNNRFIIDDMDEIGEFLNEDLLKLTQKYIVYTSEKVKETKIVKANVRSTFSIGSDNIMSYNFDLKNIDNSEILDVLNSLKANKKYYRLKSGDIINMQENDELAQLENLIDDMQLSNKDIVNGHGSIPKYRAIYLDSLKNNKYNIISTNNLFDELIDNFKKYKDVDVKLTTKDKEILRDYQVTGVKWLYNIYKCGFGAILADEMGLGKSIQLIYLIKQIIKEKKDCKILIVAPTSLIYNWKNEFDKFGSSLKYKVFSENKKKREEELHNIDDINILITTYGLVRQDKEIYQKINFELIAIDEAQNIKNINTQMTKIIKSLNSNIKIALTGTPLENNVSELWSIFDFIMPGYLANIKSFNEKYNIKDVDEDNINKLATLNKQIQPFILRRKKKDVILELPPKIENNVYIDLNKEQMQLYVAQVEKTKKEIDELVRSEGFKSARFKILQLLTRLRQICIDPSIVYENYNKESSKIEQLVKLVQEIVSNNHKILIFTSFKTALDIVNKKLCNVGITTYVIDGSVPSKKRMELVDSFNNDNTNVFLITLKAGGTGLNLTSADVVIHLDLWWNPQVENQATDRAHRIGQTNTVEVIKLVCKGTIEERILELQEKKKILTDALIEGEDRDKNIISSLSEKDIKNLLKLDNEN